MLNIHKQQLLQPAYSPLDRRGCRDCGVVQHAALACADPHQLPPLVETVACTESAVIPTDDSRGFRWLSKARQLSGQAGTAVVCCCCCMPRWQAYWPG
jgi:hypothetical protein